MSEVNKYNQIADKTPIEICISEVKETYQKSSRVVGWYAHPTEVRGPYRRWLEITEVSDEYNQHVAYRGDEAKYIATAMNYAPKLALECESLQSQLEALKKENERWKNETSTHARVADEAAAECLALKEKLAEAIRALEFYIGRY